MVINGTPESTWRSLNGMTPIELPVPRVNVHNLETKEHSTTWTVYKGTSVTPGDQIKSLWNAIPIEEVVNASENGEHKITTGASANVGTTGTGETFTLGSLMSQVAPGFDIDSLINQITTSKSSASQDFVYTAYGHESGKITVKVERTVGNQTPGTHTADTVGAPVEQYKVTFTYKPYTETERMNGKVKNPSDTNHHNGNNGRGTEETGTITSTNTHIINVFASKLQITKLDAQTKQPITTGATFELYRLPSSGYSATDTLPIGNNPALPVVRVYSDQNIITDVNGVFTIPNLEFKSDDSNTCTYYLKEVIPPSGYFISGGPLTITLNRGDKFTPLGGSVTSIQPTDVPYDWDQSESMTLTGDNVSTVPNNKNCYVIKVENQQAYELPSAGGMGTYLFTIFGVAMGATALLLLLDDRRKALRRRADHDA